MRNVIFLLPLGSEVRQFGHSGLIEKLLDDGNRVLLVAKSTDADLRHQFDDRIMLRILPSVRRPFLLEQIETILDKAHLMREARRGRTGWGYQVSRPRNARQAFLFSLQNMSARIVCNLGIVYLLGLFVERIMQRLFRPDEWFDLFREISPAVVVTNVPKVNRILPGLAAARTVGCETIVLYHTWKDISAAGRLNHDFSAIGVWNEEMKTELLRQNPQIEPDRVKIVGCAHFDCVGRKDWLIPEEEFRETLGIRPGARLIFYPAAAPWVFPEEERYIALLWEAIGSGHLGSDDIQLVVRQNPMDDTGDLSCELQKISSDIIVMRPDWRWDRKANWCYQRKSDVLSYNSILEYSEVCVSLPSTVSIECAVANLPIINIGFELGGALSFAGSIKSFWNADFYREVRESGAASLATSIDEMFTMIKCALSDRNWLSQQRSELLKRQLGVPPHASADAARHLIDGLSTSWRGGNAQ